MLLAPEHRGRLRIGGLGDLGPGEDVLAYVGSALGPGGVHARCAHHRRIAIHPHWHLDYLRPHCQILGIWVAYGSERREHLWAGAFAALPGSEIPLPRFGATDCRCPAHLVRLPEMPDGAGLLRILGEGDWLDGR